MDRKQIRDTVLAPERITMSVKTSTSKGKRKDKSVSPLFGDRRREGEKWGLTERLTDFVSLGEVFLEAIM